MIYALVLIPLGYVGFYFWKKQLEERLKTQRAALEANLEPANPIVLRDVYISREVTSGFKDYPSGAEYADVFLLQHYLVIAIYENHFGLPGLFITVISNGRPIEVDNTEKEVFTLQSVVANESAKKVKILKLSCVDARHTHRKMEISFIYLTAEQLIQLEVVKSWI